MGGVSADPVVSAVLEALGKRYLIEHGEGSDENGSYWYDRYSDGWIEQGGSTWDGVTKRPTQTAIVFPIEFENTKYALVAEGWGGGPWTGGYATGFSEKTKTTTGFTFSASGSGSSLANSFDWRACGYAA